MSCSARLPKRGKQRWAFREDPAQPSRVSKIGHNGIRYRLVGEGRWFPQSGSPGRGLGGSFLISKMGAELGYGSTTSAEHVEGMKGIALDVVNNILSVGVDGLGPLRSARQLADEHLGRYGDPEVAIDMLIAAHSRRAGATGFATGVGGVFTLLVAVPTDAAAFYTLSGRCAAAVAHLRGHDIDSDRVRNVVLLTLLGSAGAAAASGLGAPVGADPAASSLNALPGTLAVEINTEVVFRVLTRFGQNGALNLVRFVPLAGGAVSALVNCAAMRTIGIDAKKNFPRAHGLQASMPGQR